MPKIFNFGLFNEEIKNQFLNSGYGESSQVSFKRVLSRASLTEEQLGKDLYDFNIDEIKRVLYEMSPNKLATSKQNGNTIRAYINWAIREKYRSNSINPLAAVDGEWYEQFLDKSKKTVFHKNEVYKLIDFLVNEQDQAVVIGLFEGIRQEEMLGIQPRRDIDVETGMIRLHSDKFGSRTGQFTKELVSIFMRAFRQEKYLKSNGKVDAGIRSSHEANLIDSDYLIKIATTTSKGNTMPDATVFYRKLKIIQSYSDDYKYMNPQNLRNSGMLYRAYEMYKRDGELSTKQLNEICEEFDVPKMVSHYAKGKEVLGYKRAQLMLDFLNVETLKEVYTDLN